MKQLLFATTALIATASMASAEIKFSGLGRFGIGYQEDRSRDTYNQGTVLTDAQRGTIDNITTKIRPFINETRKKLDSEGKDSSKLKEPELHPVMMPAPTMVPVVPAAGSAPENVFQGLPGKSNISDTILISRFRLNVDGIAHTDGGAKFEARMRLEANENADDGNADTAKLNGARFGVSYGGLQVFAGNVDGAIGTMDNRSGNEPGMEAFIGQTSAINYSHLGYSGSGAGDNAVYFNYAIGDLRVAASYDQKSTVTVSDVIAIGDIVGTATTKVANVDRWDMSVTYTFGSVTAEVAHGQNEIDESLTLLTLGAEFGDFSGTLLVADDDVLGESLNGTAYGVSGAYAISAVTKINFAYGNGSAESDTQKFGIGVSHDLGGSVKLIGGIGQSKVGGGDGRLQADFGAYFDF